MPAGQPQGSAGNYPRDRERGCRGAPQGHTDTSALPSSGRRAPRSCLKLGVGYLVGNLCRRKTFASLFDL